MKVIFLIWRVGANKTKKKHWFTWMVNCVGQLIKVLAIKAFKVFNRTSKGKQNILHNLYASVHYFLIK